MANNTRLPESIRIECEEDFVSGRGSLQVIARERNMSVDTLKTWYQRYEWKEKKEERLGMKKDSLMKLDLDTTLAVGQDFIIKQIATMQDLQRRVAEMGKELDDSVDEDGVAKFPLEDRVKMLKELALVSERVGKIGGSLFDPLAQRDNPKDIIHVEEDYE